MELLPTYKVYALYSKANPEKDIYIHLTNKWLSKRLKQHRHEVDIFINTPKVLAFLKAGELGIRLIKGNLYLHEAVKLKKELVEANPKLINHQKFEPTGKEIRVLQFSLDWSFIQGYEDSKQAAIAMGGMNGGSNINRCFKSPKHSAYGFRWKYVGCTYKDRGLLR